MTDTAITVLALVALFLGVPLAILRFIDKRRRARNRKGEAAERVTQQRRLLAPDWSLVDRHLRRSAPQALRDLYTDSTLIVRRDLSYRNDVAISSFEPLDEEAIRDAERSTGYEALPIATTDFGDVVHLRPGITEPDTVFLTHHDGGDTEVFAESVAHMVAVLREMNPP